MNADQAAQLRAPFPKDAVGKLPKGGQQLDYVGHAAVTDRLLAVDPDWTWEPVAWDEHGAPLITRNAKEAAMWVRLTVCGVTRIGVGICAANAFELEKQLISDALRNAAMRFGVALDLWSRQPLLDDVADPPRTTARKATAAPPVDQALIEQVKARIEALNDDQTVSFMAWKAAQKFKWPWPAEACEAMLQHLDAATQSDPLEDPF